MERAEKIKPDAVKFLGSQHLSSLPDFRSDKVKMSAPSLAHRAQQQSDGISDDYARDCSKAYTAALAEPFCADALYYRRGALQKREHALGIQVVQETLQDVLSIPARWYTAEVAATYLYVYKALLCYYGRMRHEPENSTHERQPIINKHQLDDIAALCAYIDASKRNAAQTPCRFDHNVAVCIDNYFCDRSPKEPLNVKMAMFGSS